MQEAFHDEAAIGRETLARLQARRDGPGLVRFGALLGLLVSTGALLVLARTPWVFALGLALHAVAQLGCFGALHEAAHRTAFRTDALNQLVGWTAACCQLMAPPLMRAFHFAHHRHTHDLARDPELGGFEGQARWPTGALWLVNASGLPILLVRVTWTLLTALGGPRAVWERALSFVAPRRRRGVAWGSRLLVLAHAAFVAAALAWEPRLLRLYLAVPLAHALLALYVACEHRGLPSEGSVLERTRSFDPGAPARWLLWNMPYHAEHHAYPAVPFHALPALHEAMRPLLPHRAGGVIGLHLRRGRA